MVIVENSEDGEELSNRERRLLEGNSESEEEAQRLHRREALRSSHAPPRVSCAASFLFFGLDLCVRLCRWAIYGVLC